MEDPILFLTEKEKSIPKFIWNHKRLWINKAILSKKNNTGQITISYIKIYYRDKIIKQHDTGTELDMNNNVTRLKTPNRSTQNFSLLIFGKDVKKIRWRKNISLVNDAGKMGCIIIKEWN